MFYFATAPLRGGSARIVFVDSNQQLDYHRWPPHASLAVDGTETDTNNTDIVLPL